MNKLFIVIVSLFLITNAHAQEPNQVQDTLKVEQLGEVLLRAVRVQEDDPVTHSNLTNEDFENRNLGQELPLMMNYMPSVVTTTDAGAGVGYASMRVRGTDATRINVTLNGIPYNDSESHSTIWVNMPDFASSVKNLQLQRGVGTSTNGSGAFGASINILTDERYENPFAEISNSVGSFNTHKHNLKFGTGRISEYFEFNGRISTIKSDGYVDRAFSDLFSYYLQGSFEKDNTLIRLLTFGGKQKTYQAWNGIEDLDVLENNRTFNPSGMYTDENGQIQFYDNEIDNYEQTHYQILWSQRVNEYWTSNLSLNYTRGLGYFEQYREDESFQNYGLNLLIFGADTIQQTDLIRRRWLDNHFYAGNANVQYSKGKLEVNSGIYYGMYEGDHFGEIIWARYASDSEIRDRYYEGDSKKSEFTVFTKWTYEIADGLKLFGDLQGRFINYKTSGYTSDLVEMVLDEDFSFFNPKAGISYKFNSANQLYLSYGRAHREPSRTDFREGISTPEKLDDYELGWRWNPRRGIRFNANLYYMHYEDQLVLTGELTDTGRPIRTNSGKSYRFGLELDADLQLGQMWRIIPNVTFSENKNIDFVTSKDGELVNLGKTNISFSPSIVAGNMLLFMPMENLELGLLSKYVGEQYMGNTDSGKSKLDSYFINDFNISYRWNQMSWAREIHLSALVNNIFNVKYISNGYYYTYDDDFSTPGVVTTIEGAGYFPQATINFLVGLTVKF